MVMETDSKSLTLLAGVAADKGHDDGSSSSSSVLGRNDDDGGAVLFVDNNVEVQYIIDPSGSSYQVTRAAGGGGVPDGGRLELQVQVQDDGLHYTIATTTEDDLTSASSVVLGKCRICGSLADPSTMREISTELLELIERHLPHFPTSNFKFDDDGSSLEEQSSCLNCVRKLYEWNEFCEHVNDVQHGNQGPESEVKGDEELNSKKNKIRYKPKSTNPKASILSSAQEQCKNLLMTSPYHFLVKRELSCDDWEAIAERLVSTKSNSSPKIKDIEALTMSKEKCISIFCMSCCKSVPGAQLDYLSHVQELHKGEDLKLPCDICGVYFPLKDTSARSQDYFPHWISHFFFEKCTHEGCPDSFPNKITLNRHLEFHQNRPRFPCSVCGKVLGKQATLDLHLKTHLPVEEKRKQAKTCPICGKIIFAPSLKAHMFSVHSEERPWNCDICPATFKHKSDLNGHRKTVHDKIRHFVCNICDQRFGHQCGLRVHLLKHENNRQFVCPVCSKRFITRWHLRKHQTTHKTVKDIICEICNKGFKKEESLREHLTLHTGEKPFSCHICGRKVRVLSNLYKHFQVHKKNKTWKSKQDMDALLLADSSQGKNLVVPQDSHEIIIPSSDSTSNAPMTQTYVSTTSSHLDGEPTIVSYEILNADPPDPSESTQAPTSSIISATDTQSLTYTPSKDGSQLQPVYETTVWISN